jgi:pimeloyl-ACP methyl ester carboxylesterase
MPTGFVRSSVESRFFAKYDAVLDRWPLPATELDIVTSFGSTRVRRCGRDGGPPLVLLPGANLTSLSWRSNVAALGEEYALYLVDTLGEIGMSTASRVLPDAATNVSWLEELLDNLDLAHAHFVGASRGGWLSIILAAAAPHRVRTLTVIEPPGLVPFGARWYTWLAGFGIRALISDRFGGPELGPFLTHLFRALPWFRMRVRSPQLLTGDQLRGVQAPTRVLLGECSALGIVRERVERASLIPHAEVHVIQGANHAFPLSQANVVNRHILASCHSYT